jgi:hypothetical protein
MGSKGSFLSTITRIRFPFLNGTLPTGLRTLFWQIHSIALPRISSPFAKWYLSWKSYRVYEGDGSCDRWQVPILSLPGTTDQGAVTGFTLAGIVHVEIPQHRRSPDESHIQQYLTGECIAVQAPGEFNGSGKGWLKKIIE